MKVTLEQKRVKGKRGRGASGKTIVFGILKRKGKVYTEIVPDASRKTLQDIIRGRVDMETIIHSDGWRGYTDWWIWDTKSILGFIMV